MRKYEPAIVAEAEVAMEEEVDGAWVRYEDVEPIIEALRVMFYGNPDEAELAEIADLLVELEEAE